MLNFDWLADVPLSWARLFVILAFIAPLVFTLLLKKEYIFLGAPDRRPWRNLKYWTLFLVAVQVAIYVYF